MEHLSTNIISSIDSNIIKKEWKKLGSRQERINWVNSKHEVCHFLLSLQLLIEFFLQ
jgi:hypothetical protein